MKTFFAVLALALSTAAAPVKRDDIVSDAIDIVNDLNGSIQEYTSAITTAAATAGSTLTSALETTYTDSINSISSLVSTASTDVKALTGSVETSLETQLADAVENVISEINSALDAIGETNLNDIIAALDPLEADLATFITNLNDVVPGIATQIESLLSSISGGLVSVLSGLETLQL